MRVQPVITNGVLSAFQPNPVDGNIIASFPLWGVQQVKPLTDLMALNMHSVVGNAVKEAQAIKDNLAKSGGGLPHTLEATASDWTLFPALARSAEPDKHREDIFIFKGPMGHHVLFNGADARHRRIGVGWSGKSASCYQLMSTILDDVADRTEAFTDHYQMNFRGEGVLALANFFSLKNPSLAELALALTNHVYFSKQYPEEYLLDAITINGTPGDGSWKKDELTLKREGSEEKWAFRDDSLIDPQSLSSCQFFLSSGKRGEHGRSSLYIDVSKDHITVHVPRHYDSEERFMPLSPPLLELWQAAKLLVKADPDDGGHMVRTL